MDPMEPDKEVYISVDVESAGPHPARYSLLSIGACLALEPEEGFYVELQPDHAEMTPGAARISGLSLEKLTGEGSPPGDAMQSFADWIGRVTPQEAVPVCVAFNAPFDWMFINDYFHRYLGRNPFGHSALDIKAAYLGLAGVQWHETSLLHISESLGLHIQLSHNALQDARDQAAVFRLLLAAIRRRDRQDPPPVMPPRSPA
jgi:DNA polymerase III epsilon subunit-like protein